MSEIWVFLNIPKHSLYSFTKKFIWKILFENVNIFTNNIISVEEAAEEGTLLFKFFTPDWSWYWALSKTVSPFGDFSQ